MPPLIDLSGQRFGRIIAIHRSGPPTKGRGSTWHCRCDCGNTTDVPINYLRAGHTRSCGCLKREWQKSGQLVHGHARKGRVTPERYVWNAMIQRCTNPKNEAFENYGGRGITVCDEWRQDFRAFLRDMGLRPSPQHSIDRTDNNGPYAPSNCQWIVKDKQSRNKRSNRILEHNGERLTLVEWAERAGLGERTLYARLKRGWSLSEALARPLFIHQIG